MDKKMDIRKNEKMDRRENEKMDGREKKMDGRKNELVEVVFIMDRSGSMSGLEEDTIGGFNAMLEKQKKESGNIIWSTVLFDHISEVVHDRVPVDKVKELDSDTYYVRGSTALLDAVGGAIHHIGNVHKYARPEDRPEKTLFVITTDGMENASRRYNYDKVRQMIQRQKEKYGWEFLFLGANMDAVTEAGKMGIRPERAVRFKCDKQGLRGAYESVAEATARYCVSSMSDGWKRSIEKDYEERK